MSDKKYTHWQTFQFALGGVKTAWKRERSFRTEIGLAIPVFALMLWKRPEAIWWVAVSISTALVLAAELLNTAVECVCDALHPEKHPLIGIAKDCAAGAVLVCSASALLVLVALLGHLGGIW